MPIEAKEGLNVQEISRRIDELILLYEAWEEEPTFYTNYNGKDVKLSLSRKITHRGNSVNLAQVSLAESSEEKFDQYPLTFFVFQDDEYWSYGKLNGEKLLSDAPLVKKYLDYLNTEESINVDDSVLDLFYFLIEQFYLQRPGSAFWEDSELRLDGRNSKIQRLINSFNLALDAKQTTVFEENKNYFSQDTEIITTLRFINLYRLPESEGSDPIIEVALTQSDSEKNIVLRIDEKSKEIKVWMVDNVDPKTIVAEREITEHDAQIELTNLAVLLLKPILQSHNLTVNETGMIELVTNIINNNSAQSKTPEFVESGEHQEFCGQISLEILEEHFQKNLKRLKSEIRQYELYLNKIERNNSAYTFYEWKICCAYAEIDYLRLWYELTKNRSEFGPVRNDYLSAIEIAGTLDEKREVAKKWQMKTGSLRLRRNFAMSRRSRELLKGIGEV